MKLVKVAAATLNQTPLDWENNRSNILGAIREAHRRQVSVLCLPELCICGYGCEDAFLSSSLRSTAFRVLDEILPYTEGLLVSVGLPVSYNNLLFNTACLVGNGRILGFVAKRYLARSGIHYEPRWFKPWPVGKRIMAQVGGNKYPFGDILFDCRGIRIAFEICEDAWVAERPAGSLALKGVDIILNPSASHFAFRKHAIRERLVLEGSRAFGVTYIYSNLLGNEAGRAIYDGGAMIASGGKLLANSPRFSFQPFQLTHATVDVELTRMGQARSAGRHSAVEADSSDSVAVEFEFPETPPEVPSLELPGWETSDCLKEEEFFRGVAIGLFDYLRKSRSNGFVVSLSGGADSSAVACLTALMIHLVVTELGLEGIRSRLTHVSELSRCNTAEKVVTALLSCVYQSTRNSSDTTRQAARCLAAALKASYFEFDVDAIARDYQELVSSQLGRHLTWGKDDIALQNIQARVRSPGIWMLANLRRALLLSTSNRSEAAVGYATMDGDTSGGLSPIAGVDKAFLRHWLEWLEKAGPEEHGGVAALSSVNIQHPTAELRPPDQEQTDEGDLMPYDLLDAIERAAIGDKKSPLEVFRLMEGRFGQYSRKQLGKWVRRFFVLWCQNQWKRERYAPSFHLDDQNLDPKTWCRFPILSGGFQWELAELERYLTQGENKVEPVVPAKAPGGS